MRKSLLKGALLTMLLGGCAARTISSACPTLIDYPEQYRRAAAAELVEILASHPHVAGLIVDYSKIRDQIRVCRGMG